MESIILNSPVCLIGFIISLILCLFAIVKKAHVSVTVVSAALFVFTVTYALLKGAGLYETGAVAVLFFIVNLIPLWNQGGDR